MRLFFDEIRAKKALKTTIVVFEKISMFHGIFAGPDRGRRRDPDPPEESRLPARGPDHGTDARGVTQG